MKQQQCALIPNDSSIPLSFYQDHRSFHELGNIYCHISNDHHDDQEKGLATKRSELLSEKPIVPNRYRPAATSSSAYNEDYNADNEDEKS